MKTSQFSFIEKNVSTLLSNILFSVVVGLGVATLAVASGQARAASVAGLPDFTELVEKSGPAVVNIRTTDKVQVNQGMQGMEDEQMQEFFRRFFWRSGTQADARAKES